MCSKPEAAPAVAIPTNIAKTGCSCAQILRSEYPKAFPTIFLWFIFGRCLYISLKL